MLSTQHHTHYFTNNARRLSINAACSSAATRLVSAETFLIFALILAQFNTQPVLGVEDIAISAVANEQTPNKTLFSESTKQPDKPARKHLPMAAPSNFSLSTTSFALDLLRNMAAKDANGNIFFSPASISVALGMVYAGAKGDSASQLHKALFSAIPESDEHAVHEGFQKLIEVFAAANDSVKLSLANRAYLKNSLEVLPTYLELLKSKYHSELQRVEFTEETRQAINQWVQGVTQDKIKDLLPPGSVDATTNLALVNAIYFKGNWKNKFDAKDTLPNETFFVAPGNEVKVAMMAKKNMKLPYDANEELNSHVILLPYVRDGLSMAIILPQEKFGLNETIQKLTAESLLRAIQHARTVPVHLKMPKFKLEQSTEVIPVLKDLGVKNIFDNSADLSKISKAPLFVSDIFHKAFVEVNEEGTEAAAGTGAAVKTRSYRPPGHVTIDHPFVFAIIDQNSAQNENQPSKTDLSTGQLEPKTVVQLDQVNEEGTEAAAATGAVINLKSARIPDKPVELTIDHPFIFAILDRQTPYNTNILFFGLFAQPPA